MSSYDELKEKALTCSSDKYSWQCSICRHKNNSFLPRCEKCGAIPNDNDDVGYSHPL